MNRRSFIQSAAAGAAFVNLNPRAMGANERVTLALIGGRSQGRAVALRTIQKGGVIKTFCDLDDAIIGKVGPEFEKAQSRKLQIEHDYRKVLEDKDIDAVIVAAPDHWHTHMGLNACAAGKDVYLEKPLSQTIEEGHLLRDATRKYKRVMQVGTHRRSGEHFRSAAEYVGSGALGKVCRVKAWISQLRETIGTPPDSVAPATCNYDVWLGPAPARAFNSNRFHYTWRFFWDYGNTELGNQGVHVLDVALAGIQAVRKKEHVLPSRISSTGGIYWLDDAKEVPDTQMVGYDFGDLMLSFELESFSKSKAPEGAWAGTSFHGTDGTMIVTEKAWTVYDKGGKLAKEVKMSGGSHEGNFLECVKSRQKPHADVEIGRLSTTLCHLGNISYKLKRSVEFDVVAENFGSDKAANALMKKEYRAKYPRPKV